MKQNWIWKVTPSGTLQIFNGTALYWEIEGCHNYTEQQQKEIAQEFINGYIDTLEKELNEDISNFYYPEILEKMKKYPETFKDCIDFLEAIVNPKLVEIDDIIENLNIKQKCPRCAGKLYKSSSEDFTFYCPACQENFYSFECMGEVKDVIEELQRIENKDAELILAFADGNDTTDYAFIEDNTAYNDYTYLTVNGSFDNELY